MSCWCSKTGTPTSRGFRPGEVEFQKGPKLSGGPFAYEWPLRDLQGGLWLVTDAGLSLQPARGPTPPPKPAVVHRMTGPDNGEDFNAVGLPRLVDAAGCVWLVLPWQARSTRQRFGPPAEDVQLENS